MKKSLEKSYEADQDMKTIPYQGETKEDQSCKFSQASIHSANK